MLSLDCMKNKIEYDYRVDHRRSQALSTGQFKHSHNV